MRRVVRGLGNGCVLAALIACMALPVLNIPATLASHSYVFVVGLGFVVGFLCPIL